MFLPFQNKGRNYIKKYIKKRMKIYFCTKWKEIVALEYESISWISDCFFYSRARDSSPHLRSREQVGTQLITFFFNI